MVMAQTQSIKQIWHRWIGKEETEVVKKEKYVSSVISTHAFLKMSLQDKMLSLGKLITLFRAENGYTPQALEEALGKLNRQMNRETLKNWNTHYSR